MGASRGRNENAASLRFPSLGQPHDHDRTRHLLEKCTGQMPLRRTFPFLPAIPLPSEYILHSGSHDVINHRPEGGLHLDPAPANLAVPQEDGRFVPLLAPDQLLGGSRVTEDHLQGKLKGGGRTKTPAQKPGPLCSVADNQQDGHGG